MNIILTSNIRYLHFMVLTRCRLNGNWISIFASEFASDSDAKSSQDSKIFSWSNHKKRRRTGKLTFKTGCWHSVMFINGKNHRNMSQRTTFSSLLKESLFRGIKPPKSMTILIKAWARSPKWRSRSRSRSPFKKWSSIAIPIAASRSPIVWAIFLLTYAMSISWKIETIAC